MAGRYLTTGANVARSRYILPMRRRASALTLLLMVSLLPLAIWAQECHFDDPPDVDRFDATAKDLSDAKSCAAAVALMYKCAWGSSADAQLAPIAIGKCEKTFFDKLSERGKERYGQEMQLCAYEYARQEGTLYISFAALCKVDIAAGFAANPRQAEKPAPRASFDCARAKTPLETTICSDIGLGRADLVLSRAYASVLKNVAPAYKGKAIRSQRDWLQRLPPRCGLTASSHSRSVTDCVREEFERRFTDLDGCEAGETENCLGEIDADEIKTPPLRRDSKPRASFDCERPSTALEIVICADAQLGEEDLELSRVYKLAKASMGSQADDLIDSERRWLRYVNGNCPLGAIGGIPPMMTRACVRSAYEVRIQQLRDCPAKNRSDKTQCLNDFRILEQR
jgi:uncharacterized protein